MSSATTTNIGLAGLANAVDNQMAWFNQNNLVSVNANLGDMAFRLHGTLSEDNGNGGGMDVPEPAPLALLGLGLVGLGVARRRKA